MADLTDAAPGISEALAESRAGRVRDLRYALTLRIPDDSDEAVHGDAHLAFDLTDAGRPLLLDFAPRRPHSLRHASVNGVPARLRHDNGHLVVEAERLREGANRIELAFESGDGPLNRRPDFMYTLFVPARAHEVLPCFDQPSIRARWSLTLDLPTGWTAVANAAEVSSRDTSAGLDRPRVAIAFAETEPIPTYLLAFASGRLSAELRTCAGRPMRLFHHDADPVLLAQSIDTIVRIHEQAIDWLESYTGIPYPFAKLDVAIVPAFQFSGMEHPGVIYYNASALLLDAAATRQQLTARIHLIAHETAHMWFGNLVTMRWFSDVWMKEVFANLVAARIVARISAADLPQHAGSDDALAFLHAHYPAAYDVDRTDGTNPIRQPLANLLDAWSLYGPIVYLKSPIVMRQLEQIIGPDAMRTALRRFLERFRFGSASWPDLLALLQEHATIDLAAWSRDWIAEAGRPSIRTHLSESSGRSVRVTLTTSDPVRGRTCRWPQRLEVALGYAGGVEREAVFLDGEAELEIRSERPLPDFVLPNGGGIGYGAFRIDRRSRTWLRANLETVDDPLTRASAWITMWDALLDGDIDPTAFMSLALRSLATETSELTTARILAYLERAFWIVLPPEERGRCAPSLEQALRGQVTRAGTPTAKAAFFATLRTVATTPETTDWLGALWRGAESIAGLPLGDHDRVAVVQELAVRNVPGADALVASQIDSTADPDRRAALAFVRPALSGDAEERAHFFHALHDVVNRRREPWAIEGLRWLHHPLRGAVSIGYLEPGLALLEEVQRTGDIFFPKRWADALLSGHRSPAAASIVRTFLESRAPGYPDVLRRLVLVASDLLRRVASPTAAR
ncbi:MAG: M1 family aminopeptidase [Vicinamibacterales bacterium]